MGMIQDAVTKGVEQGFENALAAYCDGYEEPEERCVMRPEDGCACLRVRWRRAKWWQFVKEPMKPTSKAVLEALMRSQIEDHMHTKGNEV